MLGTPRFSHAANSSAVMDERRSSPGESRGPPRSAARRYRRWRDCSGPQGDADSDGFRQRHAWCGSILLRRQAASRRYGSDVYSSNPLIEAPGFSSRLTTSVAPQLQMRRHETSPLDDVHRSAGRAWLCAQGLPDFSGTWTMDLSRSESAAQGPAMVR